MWPAHSLWILTGSLLISKLASSKPGGSCSPESRARNLSMTRAWVVESCLYLEVEGFADEARVGCGRRRAPADLGPLA